MEKEQYARIKEDIEDFELEGDDNFLRDLGHDPATDETDDLSEPVDDTSEMYDM